MGDFKPGTYNIQRSSDKKYLNVVGGLVQTSASDAYKWTIVAAESGQFYIQDPVYADWLYDNGSTGYLIKPVQNLNSEWSGLTTDQYALHFLDHLLRRY